MSKLVAIVVLALFAGEAMAQNTFCQRYAAALFPTDTAIVAQGNLLGAVVTATVKGRTAWNSKKNFTGLLGSALNKPYFDGTKAPKIDFTSPTNADQFTALATHLVQFFGQALGCVEYAAGNTYSITPEMIKEKHAAMAINKAVMDDFVTQVVFACLSFGVPGGTSATDDLAGPAALFGMFNKGSPAEICSADDCAMFNDYQHFMTDATTWWVKGSDPRVTEAKLVKGGYVHFDLAAADNVQETATMGGETPKEGGMKSGAVGFTRSWTMQLNTVGTYYFYSEGVKTKKASVVVALSSAASTPVSFLAVALAALFAFVAQRV
jgi:hypothetical protein